mgnify:FL=1
MHQCSSYNLPELLKMFDYWWFYHNFYNARTLSNSIKYQVERGTSVADQIKMFYNSLNDMPLMKWLVGKNRDIITKIFCDEERTEVKDLATYLYFSRCLRSDEIYQIWHHKESIVDEMSKIYPLDVVKSDVNEWKKEFDMSMYGTDARMKSVNTSAINNER